MRVNKILEINKYTEQRNLDEVEFKEKKKNINKDNIKFSEVLKGIQKNKHVYRL